MRPRHQNSRRHATLAAGFLLSISASHPTAAKPLDAEACAQLKSQRDALAATGVGDVVRQRPPERRADISPDRARQVRTLINLDGQLRFRCGMDLLLPTLKPDPVEEFVDAGDTAGSGRPSPRPPAAKKVKAAKAQPETAVPAAATPATAPSAPGAPAAQPPRTASVKTGPSTETAEPAARPPAKAPKPKTDDAYRAPPGGDPNATPLNKQLPKPQ